MVSHSCTIVHRKSVGANKVLNLDKSRQKVQLRSGESQSQHLLQPLTHLNHESLRKPGLKSCWFMKIPNTYRDCLPRSLTHTTPIIGHCYRHMVFIGLWVRISLQSGCVFLCDRKFVWSFTCKVMHLKGWGLGVGVKCYVLTALPLTRNGIPRSQFSKNLSSDVILWPTESWCI